MDVNYYEEKLDGGYGKQRSEFSDLCLIFWTQKAKIKGRYYYCCG